MWYIFPLLFALITSVNLLLAKKIMQKLDEYQFLFLSNLFTLPFLFLIIIIFYEIPQVDNFFWFNIIVSSIINIVAAILAYRAVKISEISFVSPLSAFNPVFTTLLAFLFLRESIGIIEIIGIALICLGAYLLQIPELSGKNRKNIFKNQAVWLSIVAYFLWAITPIFQKSAILHTAPQVPPYVSFIGLLVTTVLSIPIVYKLSRLKLFTTKNTTMNLLVLGILLAIGQTAAFIAFSIGSLGVITALFKTSMFFSVILGAIFLKEHNIKQRMFGTMVMFLGLILLIY